MVLIIVVITASVGFALLISGFLSQSEKSHDQIQNGQNEKLMVDYLQLYPIANPSNFLDPITLADITVFNDNIEPSAWTTIDINSHSFRYNQTVIPAEAARTFELSNLSRAALITSAATRATIPFGRPRTPFPPAGRWAPSATSLSNQSAKLE
jgi:hypothetical protein